MVQAGMQNCSTDYQDQYRNFCTVIKHWHLIKLTQVSLTDVCSAGTFNDELRISTNILQGSQVHYQP